MTHVSVIVLTKNRSRLLFKNLSSLARQSKKPNQIVVVDNDSSENISLIIGKFKKMPIDSYKTGLKGFAKLYNFAISKAKGPLLCFLNDDCFASKKWLENLVQAHKKNPQAVIQGQTYSLPKNNLYAQIMAEHYQNWLKANSIGKNNLKYLDCKNVAIPKRILTRLRGFSEKHSIGSEDLELSIRLRSAGINIILVKNAIAWHQERTTLEEFLKQHYRIAQSEALLKLKLFPRKKTLANIKSGLNREFHYLLNFKIREVILLPIVYMALFFTRIIGQKLSSRG